MENNGTALVAFNTENTELGTVQHFIDTSTREGKIKLYSALQNAEKLDEHLNEPLAMVNAVAQAVQVTDEPTVSTSGSAQSIGPSTSSVTVRSVTGTLPVFVTMMGVGVVVVGVAFR